MSLQKAGGLMKNNLISVIVPIYNVEQYARRCLDSILCQTYKNLEIILIDDGSTDNSGKICDDYAKKDRRIKVIHQENGGVSHVKNVGISLASGKYICFVDSDDTINPNHIEGLLTACENNKADIAICGIDFVKYNTTYHPIKVRAGIFNRHDYIYELIHNIHGYTHGKLYPKKLIAGLRFREDITVCEDFYFNMQLALRINKTVVINQYSYNYIHNPTSLLGSDYSEKNIGDLRAHALIYDLLKDYFPDLAQLFAYKSAASAYRQKYFYRKSNYRDGTIYAEILSSMKKYEKITFQSSLVTFKQKILLFTYKYTFPLINFARDFKIKYILPGDRK